MWTYEDFPHLPKTVVDASGLLNRSEGLDEAWKHWPKTKLVKKEVLRRYREDPESYIEKALKVGDKTREEVLYRITILEILEEHMNEATEENLPYYTDAELFLIYLGLVDGSYLIYLNSQL